MRDESLATSGWAARWASVGLLTAAFAAASVWLTSTVDDAKADRLAVQSLRDAGGAAWYSFQLLDTGEPLPDAPAPPLDTLSRLVGEDLFHRGEAVDLSGPRFNDDHLLQVEHLTGLKTLRLQSARITDAGLRRVAALNQLRRLYLGETLVTDAGLSAITGLTELTDLWLHDTPITDAGLRHLESLKHLEVLILFETRVTADGVARLQRALPHCEIAYQYAPIY